MPDLLGMLGILRIDAFLDRAACQTIVSDMRSGRHEPATISGRELEPGTVDESERRAQAVEVPGGSASLFEARLLELKPTLEAHFALPLGEPDEPQFLTYDPGGFQRPHRDVGPAPAVRRRLVSVVVFLNGQSERTGGDGYSGGSLVFYGLLGPESSQHGACVVGRSGQLVAFLSDVLHEVQPVTAGRRHTAVAWFPDAK